LEIINIETCDSPFEALSYVWGSELAPEPLCCGNGQLKITLNLDQALRNLRFPSRPRRLWVDAICIDQENFDERARQVGYMRLIYKHASSVVVWLGLKVPGVERAFAFAKYLAKLRIDLLNKVTGTSNFSEAMLISEDTPFSHPEVNMIMLVLLNRQREFADDLTRLLEREYFDRVWCIQEVVAARKVTAKCQELEMDFFGLMCLATYVERRRPGFTSSPLPLWGNMSLKKLESMRPSSNYPVECSMGNMLALLMGVRDFKSTDPRDRIFSLMGISDEGLGYPPKLRQCTAQRNGLPICLTFQGLALQHPALIPNYRKSVKDVYRDFVRFSIGQGEQVLDVLSHVQHQTDPNDNTWPSWVPKFSESRSVCFFPNDFYLSGIPPERNFLYLAGLHDCSLACEAREPDYLQLDGFRVDEVEIVSEVIPVFDGRSVLLVDIIWKQIFDIALFPRPSQQYAGGTEGLDTAFFMTLNFGPFGVIQYMKAALAKWAPGADRNEAFKVMSRITRLNIYSWLQNHPAADIGSYRDLLRSAGETSDPSQFQGRADVYVASIAGFCKNRRVYKTRSGLLGIGPQVMKPGDQVVVLFGGSLPFVLRLSGNEWHLIGDTYLHHENILMGREVMAVRSSERGFRSSRIETFKIK
jgi:hypothetical protein